jgi:hypothetical protein
MGIRVVMKMTSTDGQNPIPTSGTMNATSAKMGIACPIPVRVAITIAALRDRSEIAASGMPVATARRNPL